MMGMSRRVAAAVVAGVGLLLAVGLMVGCGSEDGGIIPALTTLAIAPTQAAVQVGQSRQIQVSGFDQNGDPIGFTATWSVEGGIGTITPGGEVGATVCTCRFNATSAGGGAVVARVGGLVARCNITVTEDGGGGGGGGGEFANLFFLHHSTGSGFVEEGDMRGVIAAHNATQGTGYEFWDHGYNGDGLRNAAGVWTGTSYQIPGDNTDPDGLHALWTTDNAARTAILANHEVIAFKSCFPASAVGSQATLTQYKAWYRAMRDFFDTRPDRLFVVMSTPPLHRLATNLTEADNARAFANWLGSDDYLAGHPNVVCFDLFDMLSHADDGLVRRNMLRWEYEGAHNDSDSHPNQAANEAVGPALAQFLIDAAEAYASSGG